MATHSNLKSAAQPLHSVQFGVDSASARAEIAADLLQPQAQIAPKYLYDALGSKLFEAITLLPEYYPTRTERSIFVTHASDIARSVGTASSLIDLGAGNCEKARRLFAVLRPVQYVAVDVSTEFLNNALRELRHRYPDIDMHALGMDFSAEMQLPAWIHRHKRLFFYPGSSIGNFTPEAALALLSRVRSHCGDTGSLLIGFDLIKSQDMLAAAYDDSLGITAAFNLNLLNHVNELLATNFAIADWRHRARFNAAHSRMEMHLEAQCELTVTWPEGERRFKVGETIHTESSYKYELPQIHALLEQAGLPAIRTWTDERNWFAVCHATV